MRPFAGNSCERQPVFFRLIEIFKAQIKGSEASHTLTTGGQPQQQAGRKDLTQCAFHHSEAFWIQLMAFKLRG